MKIKAEVEYDDDGASMAGATCGTLRRAKIITLDVQEKEDFMPALRLHFKEKMYFSTIRNVRNITEA